ncbi:hypothetical protein OQA88_911 [Cercophora sp. LCS_1]
MTHQTAKTSFLSISQDKTIAYRRFGAPNGTPLLILTHFRGVMDKFDPLLINLLSRSRPVILIDYTGVGLSTGPVATSIAQSADDILLFLSLLDISSADVLGFSLGGMVAQLITLNADPAKLQVRKLIVTGSTPSFGPGVQTTPNEDVGVYAGVKDVTVDAFKTLFFWKDEEGNEAAEAWWARVNERTEGTAGERVASWVSQGFEDGAVGLQAQIAQASGWGTEEGSRGREGSWARLKGLGVPVLVANGADDYMIPTVNSFVMQQELGNGQLVVYPKSGHGFLFQYAELFAKHVELFLGA